MRTIKTIKKGITRKSKAHKGVGTRIAEFTEATGIKKLVEWIAGEDCGCKEREEKLNKLFHYKRPKCLTEWEHVWLKEFTSNLNNSIEHEDHGILVNIYNRVFTDKRVISSCGPCVQAMIDELKEVLNLYKK